MAGWHRFVVLLVDSDIPNDVIFGWTKGAEHPLNGGARGELRREIRGRQSGRARETRTERVVRPAYVASVVASQDEPTGGTPAGACLRGTRRIRGSDCAMPADKARALDQAP